MHRAKLGNKATDPQSVAVSGSSAYVDSIESASVHSIDNDSVEDYLENPKVLKSLPSDFGKRRSNISNHANTNASSKNQATSIQTTATVNPRFEVDWDGDDDKLNPRNWPLWYRSLIIGAVSYSTWSV
jgi:hypothetical protein